MLYNDARDNVMRENGLWIVSNHATIWRWRQAYQDEMSARIQWTIQSKYAKGCHPSVVVVNESSYSAWLTFDIAVGEEIVLDASGSYDPDPGLEGRNPLKFGCFQYKEPSDEPRQTSGSAVPELNFTLSSDGRVATMMPETETACYKLLVRHWAPKGVERVCFQFHVVLEVVGSGTPPIRRYKRAILKIQRSKAASA